MESSQNRCENADSRKTLHVALYRLWKFWFHPKERREDCRCLRVGCWGEWIYEPEKKEVAFGWRKFYSEGLHDFYILLNVLSSLETSIIHAGLVEITRELTHGYKIVIRKSEEKRSFRRPNRRWHNITRYGSKSKKLGGEGLQGNQGRMHCETQWKNFRFA